MFIKKKYDLPKKTYDRIEKHMIVQNNIQSHGKTYVHPKKTYNCIEKHMFVQKKYDPPQKNITI